MNINKQELVVLTEDFRGFEKGTLGYFAGWTTDCGHNVALVAIKDKFFDEYMSMHKEFSNFDEYIAYQKSHCIHGDQYWTQPFTCIKPYKTGIMSLSQVEMQISKTDIKIEALLLEKEALQIAKKALTRNNEVGKEG